MLVDAKAIRPFPVDALCTRRKQIGQVITVDRFDLDSHDYSRKMMPIGGLLCCVQYIILIMTLTGGH